MCKEVDKMERREQKKHILNILARDIRHLLAQEDRDLNGLQEIRLRNRTAAPDS